MRCVATFGCGHDGRLGLGSGDDNVGEPVVMPFFLDTERVGTVLSIHVGGYHTFVRTSKGVYGYGSNDEGQLGTGEKTLSYSKPVEINFFGDGASVVDIACGASHTIAWMRDGLYACGSNAYGQLGLGDTDAKVNFTKISSTYLQSLESTVNGEAGMDSEQLVTHVACGTYHSLIGLKNVFVPIEVEDTTGLRHATSEQSRVEELRFYPCAVVACGKGDFGELGYDASPWDVMASREQRIKHMVAEQAHCVSQGADAENTIVSAQSEVIGVPMKKPFAFKKAAKERRPEFYHAMLKLTKFSVLDNFATQVDTSAQSIPNDEAATALHARCVSIASLKAMHLHSAVTLRCAAAGGQVEEKTYHFGCYYCNGIEGLESSVPALVDKVGPGVTIGQSTSVRMHAGDEILFAIVDDKSSCAATTSAATTTSDGARSLVFVLGKGNLGMGDDDAFEPSFVPLPMPRSSDDTVALQTSITGKTHFLIWQKNIPRAGASTDRGSDSSIASDELFAFGDAIFGQCGTSNEEDRVLVPTSVVKRGSILKSFVPSKPKKQSGKVDAESLTTPRTVRLRELLDVQCGSRHSVVLIQAEDVSSAVSTGEPSPV